MNDNVFGDFSAETYLKFQMASNAKPNYHLENMLKFDSLVLVLQYDSTATYGGSTATQKVEVFQLSETYSDTDTFTQTHHCHSIQLQLQNLPH